MAKNSADNLGKKKVAFLGAGKMGGIILQALVKNGLLHPRQVSATVAHEERALEAVREVNR